jgi:hypothetical protein
MTMPITSARSVEAMAISVSPHSPQTARRG